MKIGFPSFFCWEFWPREPTVKEERLSNNLIDNNIMHGSYGCGKKLGMSLSRKESSRVRYYTDEENIREKRPEEIV